MSSVATSRHSEFPWQVFRAPVAIVAGYAMQYDILHHVNNSQWWFPAGCVFVAVVTIFISGYDKDPGKGILGDMTANNVTWLMVILGLPITGLAAGIIGGSSLWITGALVLIVVNAIAYFGFREPGLPGVLMLAVLVVMAVMG